MNSQDIIEKRNMKNLKLVAQPKFIINIGHNTQYCYLKRCLQKLKFVFSAFFQQGGWRISGHPLVKTNIFVGKFSTFADRTIYPLHLWKSLSKRSKMVMKIAEMLEIREMQRLLGCEVMMEEMLAETSVEMSW